MSRLAYALMQVLNVGLARADALFTRGATACVPPLFIVGAPRSGTTLTYQVIVQQLRVGYFTPLANYLYGAPNILTRLLRPFLGRPAPVFESAFGRTPGFLAPAENGNFWFRWFPRDGEQGHYLDPAGLRRDDYGELRLTVGSLTRIVGRPMVFKSVYLSVVVGALAQIFEQARFVYVRRDPFFTCQSVLLARQSRRRPEEWWSVRVPNYRRLLRQPLWEQVVEQVFRTETIVQEDLARFASDRHRIVQYEELCRRPRDVVAQLAHWLAPLGYEAYADLRIPAAFELSSRVRLAEDLAGLIRERLSRLSTPQRGGV